MKRTFWILGIVFLVIIIVSKTRWIYDKIAEYKFSTSSMMGSDKYKYGDIYGLSYYPYIKEEFGSDKVEVKNENYSYNRKINLCLVHDSYLMSDFLKSKQQIPAADTIYSVEYPWWRGGGSQMIQLDTTKTNILVFEIVERNFHLLDREIAMNIVTIEGRSEADEESGIYALVINTIKTIFNDNQESNLIFLFFDYRFFTPVREFKSNLKYKLFKRINPDVFISRNSEYLFYSGTLPSVILPVTDKEIYEITGHLNNIHDHYKNLGFDEVYFSIIPNPISIIKPECENYNHLIPRIQSNQNLRMKMIDVYSVFQNTPHKIYYTSDTHWNQNGFHLWLNELNRTLSNIN